MTKHMHDNEYDKDKDKGKDNAMVMYSQGCI